MRYIFWILITGVLFSGFLISCNHSNKNSSNNVASNTTDSIHLLTEEIKSDTNNYHLYLLRAKMYLKKNDIDRCLRDLTHTLDLNNSNPSIYYVLSDAYFVLGKIRESFTALKKAVKLAPDKTEGYLKLARLNLILRQYQPAKKFTQYAMQINPNSSQAFFVLAMINIEQGDTAASEENLRVALDLDSTYFEANMKLGVLLNLQKNTLSITYFKQALKIKPENQSALYSLALAYQNVGKIDSALIIYDSILMHYPSNKQVYFNKGYIYLVEKGDFKHAEQSFRKAISLDNQYVKAVYNLGRTYEAQGSYKKATIFYRKALDIVPNYPLAIDGLNRIEQ